MNAKQRAKELVDKMLHAQQNSDIETAKRCALATARELKRLEIELKTIKGPISDNYWDEVKDEIRKLKQ